MSLLAISGLVLISIVAIIYLTSRLKLNAFISLLLVSLFLAFATLPSKTVISTIKEGFGSTMASIGFLIILGAIIGITLDKTGGTRSIANWILSKTGEKKGAQALGITGFITGLPIFCDSGFIILSGLGKSISSRSGIAMPFIATVLASSLYSVHCLIPPHPGALAAAGAIDANIGLLILLGILFAIPAAVAAFFWSRWMTAGKNYPHAAEIKSDSFLQNDDLPPVSLSFLPIIVPLFLITLRSLLTLFKLTDSSILLKVVFILGEPVVALAVGVVFSLFLVRLRSVKIINEIFSEAIEKSGPILIITAAGGMFGMVIKSTGTGEALGKLLAGSSIGIMVPFLIAVIMKTAQGSSTVAIITTASFIGPMLPMLGLDSEWGKLLAMLSMGAGSMLVSHANDSYFWVVSRFSDVDPSVTLKVYSTSTIVMGSVVMLLVWFTSMIVL